MKFKNSLCWRAEMACRAAWPAAEERPLGQWVLRYTDDTTRRTGSLNPLPGCHVLDAATVDAAEIFFAERGRAALVRTLDFLPEITGELVRRGYRPEGATLTVHAPLLTDIPGADGLALDLARQPTAAWLALRAELAGSDPTAFGRMLASIAYPMIFALAHQAGRPVAQAYGVIVDGMLILEAVATHSDFRGRGIARRMLGSLMTEAAVCGAAEAALQVVADNAPARALYARLGFGRTLFGYAYYRQPGK